MNVNPVTRAMNDIFQPSSGHDSFVNYSIEIACTLNLSGGQTGTVFLEMSDQWDFGSGIVEVCRAVNGNTGTLTLGLGITQTQCSQIGGMIPAAYYARIRTANTSGSPTFTYRSGQEANI